MSCHPSEVNFLHAPELRQNNWCCPALEWLQNSGDEICKLSGENFAVSHLNDAVCSFGEFGIMRNDDHGLIVFGTQPA